MKLPKTAIEYIHARGKFTGTPGLHRIRALCDALGNPQDSLRFVHIAGTNGKGSTACMTASILQTAGWRTGLYTSPYLIQFHERIRVNGKCIPDDALTRLTEQVAAVLPGLSLPAEEQIGEFEFTTAVAFLYFAEQHCDIVVLETGLGGRYDATNVIRAAEVCAITPISLDHVAILGDSIAQIAAEKAAIIHPHASVISAPGQFPQTFQAIQAACDITGASWYHFPTSYRLLRSDCNGSTFVYQGQGYTVAMPGIHQMQNAITTLGIIAALRKRRWKIPMPDAVHGLARARMPGRLEQLRESPLVFLDGAHNRAGVTALCHFIDTMLKMRRLTIIMGMMRDKEYEPCIPMLAKRADVFCACAPPTNGRELPAPTIAAIAERYCATVYDCDDVGKAIRYALHQSSPNDCVLICGSLYLVGEAEKILRTRQKTPELLAIP